MRTGSYDHARQLIDRKITQINRLMVAMYPFNRFQQPLAILPSCLAEKIPAMTDIAESAFF
tara:strand:- start:203 stop:385 length:183 start_codon:yes stop_codon:yes gene_type:complete